MGALSVDELNAHLAAVSFDRCALSLPAYLSSLESATGVQGHFDFYEVIPLEVSEVIKISYSQEVGVDEIPQKFVALSSDQLSSILCKIFDKSLATSSFPQM